MKENQKNLTVWMRRITAVSMLAAAVFISGCKEDDPEPVNEEELITTINLVFTKLNASGQPDGSDPILATWYDEDGSGSVAPVIDGITLQSGSTYSLDLELLDESKTPVGNITEEISEEDEEHQFFFQSTDVNVSVSYEDTDSNGKPVGLSNSVTTSLAGQGTFKVILRHMPDKNASGVSAGNVTNAGGETDIETTFSLSVVD